MDEYEIPCNTDPIAIQYDPVPVGARTSHLLKSYQAEAFQAWGIGDGRHPMRPPGVLGTGTY